jgi:acyl-CoA synthetase (AMP-forming)/AMP-acid ligase II
LRIAAADAEPLRPLEGVRVRLRADDSDSDSNGSAALVHSPTMMMGYLDDPEGTRLAFVERDGVRWVRVPVATEGLLVE